MTAPEPSPPPAPPTRRPPKPGFQLYDQPNGVGGWLLLFVVGQSLALVINLVKLPGIIGSSFNSLSLVGQINGYGSVLVLEVAGQVMLVAGGAFGLWLISRKHPRAPRFYTFFLAAIAGYAILDFFGLRVVMPQLAAFVEARGKSGAGITDQASASELATLRMAAYALIWMLYWRSSLRVASTFVAPPEQVVLVPAPHGP